MSGILYNASFPATAREALRQEKTVANSFAALFLAVLFVSTTLAGWAPLGFSMVTVFLFAGPHNWMEFRYFLTRMPAHWGSLRAFFTVGIGGTLLLGAGFMAMPTLARKMGWDHDTWITVSACWHSLLLLWVATLVALKKRPRTEGHSNAGVTAFSVALLLIALVWTVPQAWDLTLVYLHPLIALTYLDREIGRRRPELQKIYRHGLLLTPLLLALLFWRLRDAPPLVGDDMLTLRILRHAGVKLLTGVPLHFLVAAHAFMEMLHYAVWVFAIPLLTFRDRPWRIAEVPVYRRRGPLVRGLIAFVLCAGVGVVIVLWGGFIANYPLTRDLYFTVAILHVLAEVPFLIQLSQRKSE